MQSRKIHVSSKMRKIATNFYLFFIALHLVLASAHLINILINVTVEGNIGPYFEFVNASIDRIIVYTLAFIAMLYITVKPRKIPPILLLLVYVFGSYFAFMQILDMLIIIISFAVLTWWLTSPEPFSTMNRKKTILLVVIYIILVLVVVEISALICRFIFPFFPRLSQQGNFKYMVDLETKMFLLTGCLAPVLAVLFLFSWVAKLKVAMLRVAKALLQRLKHRLLYGLFSSCNPQRGVLTLFTQSDDGSDTAYLKKPFSSLLLACSIIFSFLLALYPYMPGLNPDMHPIGVDTPFYEEWLAKSANKDFFSVLANYFYGWSDRPLSLLILYLARCASGLTALTIVQFSPLILAPVLVLAVYFFMRARAETNDPGHISSLAAFLSVSSFHISIGMYGFLLSNWMALIELYLFMGLYFGGIRKKSYLRMAAALLLSSSLLFTHAWTWGMAIGVLFVYLLLRMISKSKKTTEFRFETRVLIVIILVNVLVSIVRNHALGFSAGDFETLQIAQKTVSMGALGSFWDDLLYTFLHTMYGFFVNPMALFLAVLGGFIIVFDDRPVNRYLTSWLVALCVFFVLGSGWEIKARILYNLPLPVFQSFGLAAITNSIQKVFEPNKTSLIRLLIILFVLLVGLNYAFRCTFTMSRL